MTDDTEREEIVEKRIRRVVDLNDLHHYAEGDARISDDIISEAGSLLLPRDTRVSTLFSSASKLETLRRDGIASIPIVIDTLVNLREVETSLKVAEVGLIPLDAALAKETAEQVEDVYDRITRGVCSKNDVSGLAEQGRTLARQIAGAPQVMFCLGHVRSWDKYTGVHSLNVALLSSFLTEKMFPDQPERAEFMAVGGILHDLGKARVPQEILNKPSKLNPDEFDIMKKHSEYGVELARSYEVTDARVLDVIRAHHERYNGGGYPGGLSGSAISIEARIASVADVFDALTAKRVYKDPMAGRDALSIMMSEMSSAFDPQVMRVLLLSLGLYPPGSFVELSDGSLGIVMGVKDKDLLRPRIMLQYDSVGRKMEETAIVDLAENKALYIAKATDDMGKIAF